MKDRGVSQSVFRGRMQEEEEEGDEEEEEAGRKERDGGDVGQ